MEWIEHGGEVEITGVGDFDPVRIFECGQCFRWTPDADASNASAEKECPAYTGVAFGRAARVRHDGGRLFISGSAEAFNEIWRPYFDLDLDYAAVRGSLCVDDYMTRAAQNGAGIRILRQEPWEALCSFILSQCNNIPRIRRMIETLCRLYGEPVEFEGTTLYTFPPAAVVARLTEEDLAPLRCGYRAPYVLNAARAVDGGALDLGALAAGTPEGALAELKKLDGVGDKVAACAVLFGLHMLGAFPIDTWIKKALRDHYGGKLDPARFGPYAGVAQQYMFYYARCGKN